MYFRPVALCAAVTMVTGLGQAIPTEPLQSRAFPELPFSTNGGNIVNSAGAVTKLAGTNWPGHGILTIPEGLQYQSVATIVDKIKSLGMNVVRLTYAIEMIDDIYSNGGSDISLEAVYTNMYGQEEGTRQLDIVLSKNPQFSASTTRLEVFDAVAAELASQGIYIILDNHMSRAAWCCSGDDGNSWWGDTDFDLSNWVRGLSYMADHVAGKWTNVAAMSLRNELREPTNNDAVKQTYNWDTWYRNMRQGADAVHNSNPDTLVVLSGLNYDTTLQPVVRGQTLSPGSDVFSFDDFSGYSDKLVLELHNYNLEVASCDDLQGSIYNGGAQAMNPEDPTTVNVMPVLLTEFGFPQDGEAYQTVYPTCLASWLPDNVSGWTNWVLAGSYYERQGIDDYDETWGLLSHDWTGWRDESYVESQLTPMVQATLKDN